jgi:hypothetical protein
MHYILAACSPNEGKEKKNKFQWGNDGVYATVSVILRIKLVLKYENWGKCPFANSGVILGAQTFFFKKIGKIHQYSYFGSIYLKQSVNQDLSSK